jgi:D-alanyl-D-alanine-carboxypeptidase/D-alanyl-D-alanine-endopeptidase
MRIIFFAVFLIFLGCSTNSQNKNRSISNIPPNLDLEQNSSTWIDQVKEISKDSVDSGYNAGIAVGVIDESGKQSIYTFGQMDVAENKAISKSTIFEIGSITKVLTAELLAKFVTKGRVSLDDEVKKFIPELADSDAGKITLKELSTHTSGLPRLPNNINPKDPQNPYYDYTLEQLMSFLKNYKETKAKPYGYNYSNLAVGLLGQILAMINSKDYEETLREEVLAPLNLPMTITLSVDQKNNFATPYSSTSEKTSHWDIGILNGAGGVRATIQEMLHFAQAQLKPESTPLKDAILLTQKIQYKGEDAQMGLGWSIRNHVDGFIFSKDGGTGGFSSLILIQPTTGRALTLLSNSANTIPCLITYFKKEECKIKKAQSMSLNQLQRYLGKFESENGPNVEIVLSQNKRFLIVDVVNQPPWVLKPESDTVFNFTELDARIVFPEGNEPIKTLVLQQNGKDYFYKKLESTLEQNSKR